MNFNNNVNKFLSLDYGCQDDIAITRKFDINGTSLVSLKKDSFLELVFSQDEFCRMLEYLLVANSIDTITGVFNYDRLKVSLNKLLDHMIGYTQVANEPTYTSGSQIDYVYMKSALLEAKGHCSYKDHCSKHILF